MTIHDMDKEMLSNFIIRNNYPQMLESVIGALKEVIPDLKGKINIRAAESALRHLEWGLKEIDRLPQ